MFFIIVLYTLQSFFCKTYSQNYPGRSDLSSPVFTVVSGFVVAVTTFLVTGFRFSASLPTVLLSVVCAVSLIVYNTALIKASSTGPYSVLMVFAISGGIIVPAVSSAMFGDVPSVVKVICILVILSSVYLISRKGNETYTDKKVFFITCVILALANGAYSALLDIQQRVSGADEKEEMVALTYFFAASASSVMLLFREKKDFFPAFRQTKKSAVYLIVCSLIVASAINLLTLLISTGFDLTLLYTLENASVYVLSVVLSCIIFKERLSKLNVAGCIVLCVSLVLMSVYG